MRTLLSLFLLASTLQLASQQHSTLLTVDPLRANGTFILNNEVREAMEVASVVIEIVEYAKQPDGSYTTTIVETLEIGVEQFFAQADPALNAAVPAEGRLGYHLVAYGATGEVLEDWESIGDPVDFMYPACSAWCNSDSWAWMLTEYTNGSSAVLDLTEATDDGAYFYFYVEESRWWQFSQQYTPQEWNLPSYQWSQFLCPPPLGPGCVDPGQKLLRIDEAMVPADAKDETGLQLGTSHGDCYAIYKSRGPWHGLTATTDPYTYNPALCVSCSPCGPGSGWEALLNRYNTDGHVQSQLGNMDPLSCTGNNWAGDDDDWQIWGDDIVDCENVWEMEYWVSGDDIDLVSWTVSTENCSGGAQPLQQITGLQVAAVDRYGTETVLAVPFLEQEDPRLVEVPKTPLAAGLYRLTVIRNNGTMRHVYAELDQPLVANANFASFTTITVYPVPVNGGRFSIDLDLIAPATCQFDIVSAMGTPVHRKQVVFDLPGLNKHLVEVEGWEPGLYYGTVMYQDGSADTFGLVVE